MDYVRDLLGSAADKKVLASEPKEQLLNILAKWRDGSWSCHCGVPNSVRDVFWSLDMRSDPFDCERLFCSYLGECGDNFVDESDESIDWNSLAYEGDLSSADG